MTFSRSNPRAKPRWFALAGTVAAMLVLLATAVMAAHPEVSLPGANFEIDTDANLVVNDPAPSIDWASVSETRQQDEPSGSGDDSFGQGSKEDTLVPAVVDGSIPPNKSDLLNFGVYLEENANGSFLNLFWHRVQDPSGTTNMDFEFNKSDQISSNGVTPVRTAGDLLIQYDLAQGGTNPVLWVSEWVTSGSASQCEASNKVPCWGDRQNLTAAGDATGSINTSAIGSANSDGLGAISPRTFGEAQLDFEALAGGDTGCESFGSAYLKSRSSDSFTAAMKDFIAPTPLDLDNCGTVIIRKETDPDGATDLFGYTHDLVTSPALEDDPDTAIDETTEFQLADGDSVSYNVVIGDDYTVTEDDLPDGWDFDSVDCSASEGVTVDTSAEPLITFDIDDGDDLVDCTYYNVARVKIIVVTCSEGDDSVIDSGIRLDDDDTTDVATVSAADLTAAGIDPEEFCADLTTFGDLTPGTYRMDVEIPDGTGGIGPN